MNIKKTLFWILIFLNIVFFKKQLFINEKERFRYWIFIGHVYTWAEFFFSFFCHKVLIQNFLQTVVGCFCQRWICLNRQLNDVFHIFWKRSWMMHSCLILALFQLYYQNVSSRIKIIWCMSCAAYDRIVWFTSTVILRMDCYFNLLD